MSGEGDVLRRDPLVGRLMTGLPRQGSRGRGTGMHWKGGSDPLAPSRAPSLRPVTAQPTSSASFNGICNRQ